ncbi:uncharacterized protein LOC122243885 [Penaeus japonicus]|uniref:uncharacterized protein LOC122243885 n=1 Tax=Penaeus japonicus TaxID=27405 RepID=UPI001C7149C3|nr:uncharacterized protein LOC122243885 [Penaeus japonicus]
MSCCGRHGRRRGGGGGLRGTDAIPSPRPQQSQEWCTDIWRRKVCGIFGVPWNLVVVITVLTVLAATVTPGWCQEVPETAEDCNVYPVSEDVATPKVSFSAAGEVLVGLLPQVPGEVLADLTLTITTSSTNTVLRVRRDNPKTVECWRGSYLMRRYENLPSFATEDPYEWLHVPVSLNESKILLNSLEVCPGLKVNGSNPTLVISTLKQANVVFNCQEGCPIFRDSALAAYAHTGRVPGQEVFVRGKSGQVKGQLQVIHCDGSTNNVPVSGERWQSLLLESREGGRSMRLQVGKDFSKILPQDGEKCPVFDLRASKDLLWAVGCDLREDTTVAPATPSANLMKSPNNDQTLGSSTAWPPTTSQPCNNASPPTRSMAAVVSGWMATGVMVVISVGLAAYIYMLKGENDRLRKDGDGWSISRGEIPLNVPLSLKFARDTPTPPGCVQTPRHTPKKQQQNGARESQDDFIVVHPRAPRTDEQAPALNDKAFF